MLAFEKEIHTVHKKKKDHKSPVLLQLHSIRYKYQKEPYIEIIIRLALKNYKRS